MYCITSTVIAKNFIRTKYGVKPHKFQIENLWALFTIDERLDFFAKGKLNCLITCHRLSEGIDIKGLKSWHSMCNV